MLSVINSAICINKTAYDLIQHVTRLCFYKNLLEMLSEFLSVWDTDQVRHSVRPDLGPNILLRLSADSKSLC